MALCRIEEKFFALSVLLTLCNFVTFSFFLDSDPSTSSICVKHVDTRNRQVNRLRHELFITVPDVDSLLFDDEIFTLSSKDDDVLSLLI